MKSLLLEYRNNETAHRDLHFHLGDYSLVADSYYLGDAIKEDDPEPSIEKVLIQLLAQWVEAIKAADSTRPLFLPYDFSDQCTRCLKCMVTEETVIIEPGWSHREGYSVYINDMSDYFYSIKDFQVETVVPVQLSRTEFISKINESIAHARNQHFSKSQISTSTPRE